MTAQSGLGFSGIVAIQIPDDGATGEVLTKLTPDDYDYDWLAGGGGGAPDNAEYVVMSLDATLTDERVLTAGSGISIVDGGAGGAVTINATAGGVTISAEYRFDTSIIEADPGNGDFRMDNATPASVTELYISSTDDNGNDFDAFLSFIQPGAQIYIQQDNDSSKRILFNVDATIDQTGWWTIQGTIDTSGTIFDSNAKCTIVILYQGTATAGDVFKVGTPVEFEIGVWTGDGTIQGDDLFTYGANAEQLKIAVDLNSVNDVGLLLIDPDSVLNPDGWGIIPGQAGSHDGTLLFTSDPSATVSARVLTMLPAPNSSVVAGGSGFAVADNAGFRSETLGALTFYIPRQTSGVDRAWFTFTGDTAGGSASRLQFDSYNFGDSGLQLTASMVVFTVEGDYRPLAEFDCNILLLGAHGLESGEDGIAANGVDGIQIQGQGSSRDITMYDDTHQITLSSQTGTAAWRFHKRFQVGTYVEFHMNSATDDFEITGAGSCDNILWTGYDGLFNIDSDLEVEGNGVFGPGTGSVTLDIDSGSADFLSGTLRFLAAGVLQASIQWFEFSPNDSLLINSVTGKMQLFSNNTLAMEIATDQSIRFTGTQEWDKGANIASATTLVLGTDGNSFTVTGTTDIEAISAKPIGTVIILQFAAAVTLVYDATALDLSGDVDMVTEADDTLGLYCYDGTNWRELFRTDGQNVRASGNIDDQAMVRGNGGAKRIQDTGNLIGDDDEIVMAGTVILANFTDAELDDIGDAVNTNDGKAAGAMVFNSDQGHAVTAQGATAGSVWNDGVGTTTNTPV